MSGLLQTVLHQRTVLTHQRGHVGHGADGREVHNRTQERDGITRGNTLVLEHRVGQLERNTDPRQCLVGITAIGTIGVHHGGGVGQLVVGLVVVRNHHVHPNAARMGNLFQRGDSIVHGDQKARAGRGDGVQRSGLHAVTLVEAVGYVITHGAVAEKFEQTHQQRRAGDAVHVIIAKHGYGFAGMDGVGNARRGGIHVAHEEGIVQAPEGRVHESVEGCGVVTQTTVGQHARNGGVQTQRRSNLARGSSLLFTVFPAVTFAIHQNFFDTFLRADSCEQKRCAFTTVLPSTRLNHLSSSRRTKSRLPRPRVVARMKRLDTGRALALLIGIMTKNNPPLSEADYNVLQEFLHLYNTHEFYESHEVLEALWLEHFGDNRLFYQGLIMFSTSFLHLQRNNLSGFAKLLTSTRAKLESYPDEHCGVSLGDVRRSIDYWQERLRNHSPETPVVFDPERIPKLGG